MKTFNKILMVGLVAGCSWQLFDPGMGRAQSVLISPGADWKYLDTGVPQSAEWTTLGFDDGAWLSGPAPLGFGDSGMATTVQGGLAGERRTTIYFRKMFAAPAPSLVTNLLLRVRRDDGAVVHLNGTEIWRTHMPAGPVSYDTLALWGPVVGGLEETTFIQTNATAFLPSLRAGTNVIAVEVHQYNPSSSDLVFDLELVGNVAIANLPPVVGPLALPLNQATFSAGSAVTFKTEEWGTFDPDGDVVRMDFLANGVQVGRNDWDPANGRWTYFSAVWSNVAAGTYTLSAIAYDEQGASTLADNLGSITVVPAQRLEIQRVNQTCVLTWSDPAYLLEASASLDGIFSEVAGAESGYSEAFAPGAKFFRLRKR